jgi:hypothetical protein
MEFDDMKAYVQAFVYVNVRANYHMKIFILQKKKKKFLLVKFGVTEPLYKMLKTSSKQAAEHNANIH